MKPKIFLSIAVIFFSLLIFSCNNVKKSDNSKSGKIADPKQEWAIVIHGGAGTITRDKMTPELD